MRRTPRLVLLVSLLAGALLVTATVPVPPASAATIQVTTLADANPPAGACSLRHAIQAASTDTMVGGCAAGSGADTITFAASVTGTITLSNSYGNLDVTAGILTIDGPGDNSLSITFNNLDRLMVVEQGAQLTLEGVSLIGGNSDLGGAILNQGTLTITNSTLSGNSCTTDDVNPWCSTGGGAIYNDSGATLSISGSTITDSFTYGADGLGINNGGAIYNKGGTIIITNSSFTSNRASGTYAGTGGGAIYNDGGSLTITNSTFDSNTVSSEYVLNNDGGAIYNTGGSLSISGSTFTNNTAPSNGGAIYHTGGTFTLTNSTFTSNLAGGQLSTSGETNGGAIYSGGTITITGSSFTNNLAIGNTVGFQNNGGAIYNDGGSLTITTSTFTGNQVPQGYGNDDGGAIYNDGGVLSITNSTFTNNQAADNGGAIYHSSGTFSLSGSTFRNNQTTSGVANSGNGGAIYNDEGTITITINTFDTNTAFNRAGAIYNYFGAITIDSSTLSNNTAGGYGGAIYDDGGTLFIINSTLAGNRAAKTYGGGAIYHDGDTLRIISSTIANNQNGGPLAALVVDAGSASLQNVLLANPSAPDCAGTITDFGGNFADDIHCHFTQASSHNSSNLSPTLGSLQDNGGPTLTMALLPGSPAIGAGFMCPPPFSDQRGLPRTTPCDSGAYETEAPPPPTLTSVLPTSGPAAGGTSVTLTGTGFQPGALPRFGGCDAVNVPSNTPTTIVVVTPRCAPGTVDVTVINPDGSSATLAGGFTYDPTLTSVMPSSGPAAGGTTVTLTGTGFQPGAFPTFGGTDAANVTSASATTIVAITPPHAPGAVDVTVRNPNFSSATLAGGFTYLAGPTLTSLMPTSGPVTGGTVVSLSGTGFRTTAGATTVRFGSVAATNVSCSSATTCTATSPAATSAGPVPVTVTTVDGTSNGLPFAYLPVVAGLDPTSGPSAGGTAVTLSGEGFSTTAGATTVSFGSTPATGVSCPTSTSCQATSPPGKGTVSVRVTVGGQQSADTAADDFTYDPVPTLTSLDPTSGPSTGGTSVTLTGSGFLTSAGATTVRFGSTPATGVSCPSPTSCTATSPAALSAGPVPVTVATVGGTSGGLSFGYLPVVASLSPSAGPSGGGTPVTITGAGFSTGKGATTVSFGSTPATGVSCSTSSSCQATSPAGTGTVSVRVTVAGLQSPDTSADDFTYDLTPSLTSLTPTSGPVTGGTVVTLSGTGFLTAAGATTVQFGSVAATGVSCSSPTSCQATSPAAMSSGPVQVTVTTAGGTSPGRPFAYRPVVASLSPTSGLSAGGTVVTLSGAGFSTTAGATGVTFGSTAATSVSCPSSTSCQATSPPGTGVVSVRVTVAGQTSADTAAATYTYIVPDATAMTFYGDAVVNGAPPPAGTVLQAFIGSVLCGQTTIGAGLVQFPVVSAGQIPGCGTDGVAVRFTIGGQPATAQPPVLFRSGGLAKALLYVGTPPAALPPLQVSGTVTRGGQPLATGQVQAVVNGVVCGTGTVKSGSFTLSVAANPPQAGCGMAGDPVSFRVDGVAAAGTVSFTAGATASVALALP